MEAIWIEKYRPEKLVKVVGQDEVVNRLRAYVKNQSMPHLLFAGPAGTGKTTCALALAKELFLDAWRENFTELNASVAPETPAVVKKGGKIERTTFGELAKEAFSNSSSKYTKASDLEILSIDKDYKVKFLPIRILSRHKVNKLAKIRYEGGVVRTSLEHSIIVADENGNLVPKAVKDLKRGDMLITFTTALEGERSAVGLQEFYPQSAVRLKNVLVKNPKLKRIFNNLSLTKGLSWLFGAYLAEGCVNFRGKTSGQVIFSFGYPNERATVEKVKDIIVDNFGLEPVTQLSSSGFNRNKKSSIQIRILNTQLAKFFKSYFYNANLRRYALTKRVPNFIFELPLDNRVAFLQGYATGDGSGDWNELVRFSSRSKENLIDIAWLGRISNLDTSCFKNEVRAVWKLPSYSYIKTELLDATPLLNFFKKIEPKIKTPFYALRHQLYSKRNKRISKATAKNLLKGVDPALLSHKEKTFLKNLLRLINSSLSFVLIKDIGIENYNGYVYDVSVPSSEMFWGGTTPVLLHNSDERGIQVVRTKIKDFARTAPLGNVPFKIIFLDEADALTPEAQAALRRTLERFTRTCRFILSVNYSSKIIEPIQSRCTVFRFRPIRAEDIKKYLKYIAEQEKLKLTEEGSEAIIYIASGDLRKAISALQVAASISKKIDSTNIYKITSTARPEDVKKLLESALKGDFLGARDQLDELLIQYGLSGEDIIRQIHKTIFDLNIPDEAKVELIDRAGEIEFRVVEGANERIQLEALLAYFALAGSKRK